MVGQVSPFFPEVLVFFSHPPPEGRVGKDMDVRSNSLSLARWACLVLLAWAGACSHQGQESLTPAEPPLPRPGVDGKRALDLLKKIVSFGPRVPGSQAAARTRSLLVRELEDLGVQVEQQVFPARIRGETLPLVNLWARIPGKKKDQVILLGTHYDTKITSGHPDPAHNFPFQGANDGGSGTVVLVEIARKLVKTPHEATYWLVWFDGEESVPFEWDDAQALYGSRHFVKELERRRLLAQVKAMILLDIVGAPNLVLDDESYSDARLKRIFSRVARRLGRREPLFRPYGYPIEDDHFPFYKKGIPVLDLIGLNQLTEQGIWHTKYDTVDRVSPESLAWIGDLTLAALPEVEKAFLR